MKPSGEQTTQSDAKPKRRPRIIYPPGYITDPEERRKLARELRGSMPDIMTQEQLQEMRRQS
jgi:hypothetical protein